MNFLYFNFPVWYNQIKYSYDKDVLMSKKRRKSKNTGLKIMLFLFISVIGAAAVISAVKLNNRQSHEGLGRTMQSAEQEPYSSIVTFSSGDSNASSDSKINSTVSIPAESVAEEPVITPKHKRRIIKAKHIYQQDKWPTGCESVSAVMAIHYAGIDISVDHFINNCLEKKTPPFDPNIQFGGSPYDSGGWGCYSPVITKALDKALKGTKFTAKQLVNVPVETLCAKYIDKDIPVIFWATIDMQKPEESPKKWDYNGTHIDYWMRPEHCLLLVGYNKDSYIFCDPWKKENYTYYKKDKVVTAYKGEYSQAVIITKR